VEVVACDVDLGDLAVADGDALGVGGLVEAGVDRQAVLVVVLAIGLMIVA